MGDNIMEIFDWLSFDEIKKVINMVYTILDVIRIIVPIGLIVMTTLDVVKKVINPNEKEGQKKIMIRVIAALIVFLIPTIINIVLNIIGIKKVDFDTNINPQGTPQTSPKYTTSPTIVPTNSPSNSINNLIILNCPNNKVFHNNDTIVLNTNIPISYTGSIKWSVGGESNFINVNEINNHQSLEVKIHDISFDTSATVSVEASGKKSTCTIKMEKERLDSISFLNCPESSKIYYVGEKVTLKTDIPISFNGNIEWKYDDKSKVNIVPSNDKREATIELLNRSKLASAFITVVAGNVSKTCYIKVEAIKDLKITNCPSNKKFHIGDLFVLKSNLPSSYEGEVVWLNSTSPSPFKFTPSSDQKSVIVEILNVPKYNYAFIGLGADSKSASCKINIE